MTRAGARASRSACGCPEIVGRLLAPRGIAATRPPTLPRADLARRCCPIRRISRTWTAPSSGSSRAIARRRDRSPSSAITMSTARPRRRCCCASSPRSARRARVYVPDRQREGYGPNDAGAAAPASGRRRASSSPSIAAPPRIEPLAAAAARGLDVIVVDHHVAEPPLPPAFAVINPEPARRDEPARPARRGRRRLPARRRASTARCARPAGMQTRPEPDLLQWLDLVALGTVCDVVPLTGVNRALVAQGLKVMRRARQSRARRAGRRRRHRRAARRLSCRLRPGAAGQCRRPGRRRRSRRAPARDRRSRRGRARWPRSSTRYNAERREIEARVLDAAIAQVESGAAIAAARLRGGRGLASRRHRHRRQPAQGALRPAGLRRRAAGRDRQGLGRSVAGFPLGPAVIAARQAGLLINGGGHAMAAGFTVAADKLDALRATTQCARGRSARHGEPVAELWIDGALDCRAPRPRSLRALERLGPFGAGNAEPRFAIPNLRVLQSRCRRRGSCALHPRRRRRRRGSRHRLPRARRAAAEDGPALYRPGRRSSISPAISAPTPGKAAPTSS